MPEYITIIVFPLTKYILHPSDDEFLVALPNSLRMLAENDGKVRFLEPKFVVILYNDS